MTDAAVGEVNPAGSALHRGTLTHVRGNGWARVQLGCSFFLSHRQTWPPGWVGQSLPSPSLAHPAAAPSLCASSSRKADISLSVPNGFTSSSARSVLDSFFKMQDAAQEAEASGRSGRPAATRTWLLSQRSRQRPSWEGCGPAV